MLAVPASAAAAAGPATGSPARTPAEFETVAIPNSAPIDLYLVAARHRGSDQPDPAARPPVQAPSLRLRPDPGRRLPPNFKIVPGPLLRPRASPRSFDWGGGGFIGTQTHLPPDLVSPDFGHFISKMLENAKNVGIPTFQEKIPTYTELSKFPRGRPPRFSKVRGS